MVGFEAKVLLDGVCVAWVTMLLVLSPNMSWLTKDGSGTILNQDPPWPQMIGEQTRSISADHANSDGYRYVLSYAC